MSKAKKKGVIKAKIKRGDEVVFIAGREFNRYERTGDGKVERVPYRGKVIAVNPLDGKVKVDGAMIAKRHRKANPQLNVRGGIIESEAWVDISNIALIDPKTDKPTRVKIEVRDGRKVRIAKSGEVIPSPNPFEKIQKKDDESVTDETVETEETTDEKTEEKKTEKKDKKKSAKKKTTKKKSKKSEDTSEEE